MPVRSLNSAVFKWPDRDEVLAAAHRWAAHLRRGDASVAQVWCVGSCARGGWGVGSDLDVVVVADCDELGLVERHRRYQDRDIPVPVDLRVYSTGEWRRMGEEEPRLRRRILDGAVPLGTEAPA